MKSPPKPTPIDRVLAFARVLPLVVEAVKTELGDHMLAEEMAACIAAAVELVKGADLGDDARTA